MNIFPCKKSPNGLNRRTFLSSLAAFALIPKRIFAQVRPKADAEVELVFENGDIQQIFFNIEKDKLDLKQDKNKRKFWVNSSNSMGHEEFNLTTSYEIENIFPKIGELHYLPKNKPPEMWYEARNKEGKVIYSGRVIKKTWRDNR